MSRRVVLLTGGGPFAHQLAALLAERGVRVEALVVCVPGLSAEWRRAMPPGRRARWLALAPLRWVSRRVKTRLRAPRARPFRRLVLTGPVNGRAMTRALRRLDPDVVVLARCAVILEPHLLSIPREGVVNVHPGLLPWIRGNSPVTHSVLRGVPLGASAFRVDPGIDTGALLERRLLPVRGDETPDRLWDALHRLWVEMTADLAQAALAGPLPAGTPQPQRFPLCRDAAAVERDAAAEAVGRGEARALFERWLPLCDPVHRSLPHDADAEFVPRAAG